MKGARLAANSKCQLSSERGKGKEEGLEAGPAVVLVPPAPQGAGSTASPAAVGAPSPCTPGRPRGTGPWLQPCQGEQDRGRPPGLPLAQVAGRGCAENTRKLLFMWSWV